MPQVDALAYAQRMVDEALADTRQALARSATPISCPSGRAGCWGCCRGHVDVHASEVARIGPRVSALAWGRVLVLVGRLYRARSDAEFTQWLRTAVCPLLDPGTGECTVYEDRPLACRGYAVVTPVDDCYPERVGLRDVGTPAALFAAVGAGQMALGGGRPPALQPLPMALLEWREEQP